LCEGQEDEEVKEWAASRSRVEFVLCEQKIHSFCFLLCDASSHVNVSSPVIGMFVEDQLTSFHCFAHEDSSVAPFLRRVRTRSSSFSVGGTSGTGAGLSRDGSLSDFDPRAKYSGENGWNT
jgi:hypothetical protein